MPFTQPIISPLSNAAIFLVFTIDTKKISQVRDTIEGLSDLVKTVSFRVPEDNLHAVIGIGSQAWDKLFKGKKPSKLHPFPEFKGKKHTAPSTPGDILLHIRSATQGSAYELARLVIEEFGDSVKIEMKVDGFHYFDQRDLLGFVDGTANPVGDDAVETVFIGEKDPFAGGSYVYIQKYVHDMAGWNALSVEEQEAAIGRTKLENIEFPDDKKADNAHNKINSVNDADGNELDIWRANMPFADLQTGEAGTFYIAYAANPDVIEEMLRNMFIGKPEGVTDRILDFSTALTGCAFFVPTEDFLGNLPDAP